MDSLSAVKVNSPLKVFKIGNTTCIGINGEIYLTIGPDWPLNLMLISLIIGANAFFLIIMAPKVVFVMKCLGLLIYSGCLFTYLLTAFKNQGILLTPFDEVVEEGQASDKVCRDCDVVTEDGSEHCWDCGICVRGYDHHCPLSGKCIGSGNVVPFYMFLVLIFLGTVYFCLWFLIAASVRAQK